MFCLIAAGLLCLQVAETRVISPKDSPFANASPDISWLESKWQGEPGFYLVRDSRVLPATFDQVKGDLKGVGVGCIFNQAFSPGTPSWDLDGNPTSPKFVVTKYAKSLKENDLGMILCIPKLGRIPKQGELVGFYVLLPDTIHATGIPDVSTLGCVHLVTAAFFDVRLKVVVQSEIGKIKTRLDEATTIGGVQFRITNNGKSKDSYYRKIVRTLVTDGATYAYKANISQNLTRAGAGPAFQSETESDGKPSCTVTSDAPLGDWKDITIYKIQTIEAFLAKVPAHPKKRDRLFSFINQRTTI